MMHASMILHSIGYAGTAISDLPYDPRSGTVPHDDDRVLKEGGEPIAGVYVTGWIKRGPRGVIGTNWMPPFGSWVFRGR